MTSGSNCCRIESVGKRRDGGTRYWCMEHRADATAKYGRPAPRCRYADVPPVRRHESLRLVPAEYPGGVALWGAVPPIYDTTVLPHDRGIHVHARRVPGPRKDIDRTYRSVTVVADGPGRPRSTFVVSELDAVYYMASSVFGRTMRFVACTLCSHPHLDKDWFSLNAHRRHLCAGCGRQFSDTVTGIGNPIMQLREAFGCETLRIKPARSTLRLKQANYPGGVQIWGSNPAFLWTSTGRREESGIHIHVAPESGSELIKDGTYGTVEIDGEVLDPVMVRTLMAQRALPHISDRVVDLHCPECDEPHFDTGDSAVRPHEAHECHGCGAAFRSGGRLRKTIGNPVLGVIARISEKAPRQPREHPSYLLPETL